PGFSVGIFPGENLPGLSCVSALRFVHLVGGQARLVLGGVDRAQCRPAGFEHCLLLGGRQLGAAFLAAIASMLDRLSLESQACESPPREFPRVISNAPRKSPPGLSLARRGISPWE